MKRSWVGNEAELNQRLRVKAASGHGVLTVQDLSEVGIAEEMVRRRKDAGLLIPVLREVVALPGVKLTEKGRFRSAVFSGGQGCCLARRSALALHGLLRERGPVQIVRTSGAGDVPGSRVKVSEHFDFSVYCHQRRSLPPSQVTVVDGIRTTTVERSILDFAAEAGRREISRVLSQGERERSLCWETLNQLVSTGRGRKGMARLRAEIRDWDPTYAEARSQPEEDFLRLVFDHGLPVPEVNEPIGHVIPDFLWRDLRLVVELDPYGTHSGYESFHRDRRKSVVLERQGLRVLRFTWNDLYRHPERLVSELREIMSQQARLHDRLA